MAKKLIAVLVLFSLCSAFYSSCSVSRDQTSTSAPKEQISTSTPIEPTSTSTPVEQTSTSAPVEPTTVPSPTGTPAITPIQMNCDRRENSPLHLTENDYVQTYIKWAAKTADQVNDYIEAENSEVFLDGEAINSTTTHGVVGFMEDGGLYYVQSNFDVGNLSKGNHTIRTVIGFDNKVFDGFGWYGPGTDTPTVDSTCTVIVEESLVTNNEEPSLIFHDGVVITIEKAQPLAEAVAIHGNLIQAVGSNEDILALKGPDTVVIDLQGKTIMPGFIEGHTHYIQNSWLGGTPVAEMMSNLLRYGLTSETEMHGARDFIDAMLAAEQNNQVTVRVNIFAQYNYSYLVDDKTVIDPAWYLEYPPILDPSRMVRIPGVKIFVDGAGTPNRGCPYDSFPFPSTVTDAWPDVWESCRTPYGDLYLTEAQLTSALQTIQDRGYRASFHVMGDASATITANAIETVLAGRPNSIYRHQIQHDSLLSPELVQRYVQLDIISSVPGGFNTCDADTYLPIYGEDHYEWAVNRFSLADLGAHVYAIGDWAGGDVNKLNPFRRLGGLVTLQELRSDGSVCEPPEWIAKHRIGVERALEMLTIEPAYAVSMENYIGSILPGKFADLIIISDNPLTIDSNRLIDIKVLMTMVNGKVGYCASGNKMYCP
jgi:predicted amidohydrolase YtcJ